MYRRGDGVPRDRVQAMRWDAAVLLSSIRSRTDWMVVAALLCMTAGCVTGVQRPKLPAWLAYALYAGGSGFFALHVLVVPRWTCGNRNVDVALFSTFALGCAFIAAKLGKEGEPE